MKRPPGVLREEFEKAQASGKNNFVFPENIEVKLSDDGRSDHTGFKPVYVLLSPDGKVTFCHIQKNHHGLYSLDVYSLGDIKGNNGLHLLAPEWYMENIKAVRLGPYVAVQFNPLPNLKKAPYNFSDEEIAVHFHLQSPFERESVHLIVGLSMFSNFIPFGPANHGHFMPLHLIDDVNTLKNIPMEKYLTVGAKAVGKDSVFRIACDSTPSLLHKIDKYVDVYIGVERRCDRLWLSAEGPKAKKGEKINGCRVWPWITVVACLTLVILVMPVSMLAKKRRSRNPILFRR